MPWLLNETLAVYENGDSVSPDWSFILDPKPPRGWRALDFVPTDEDLKTAIRIRLNEPRSTIGDYLRAPDGAGNKIVSAAFREVVEKFEPRSHYFMPVTIEHQDGRLLAGSHFLYKMGIFLDEGIIVEQSDVKPWRLNARELSRTAIPPRLMWRGSKVATRHIWTDRMLNDHIVVSDALMASIRERDLSGYVAMESRIDSTQ